MSIVPQILGFQGEYRWLSNFWPSPFESVGCKWPTVEHAYAAYKSEPSKFSDMASWICAANLTPGQVKRFGRTIKLREDWEDVKVPIMSMLIHLKFNQNDDLRQKLLDTGDAYLEETNTWNDTFWGVCNGIGKNNLGKILMQARAGYKEYYRNVGVPLCLNS